MASQPAERDPLELRRSQVYSSEPEAGARAPVRGPCGSQNPGEDRTALPRGRQPSSPGRGRAHEGGGVQAGWMLDGKVQKVSKRVKEKMCPNHGPQ